MEETKKHWEYRVIDFQEGIVVGKYHTRKEARMAEKEFIKDTEGDCEICIDKWDGEKWVSAEKEYKFIPIES